ncbi:MAG: ion channel activity [Claussenomyces sp. TS43310]|nr:MAG: ion channel activity [Claussenomyces sp. TS43310]
MAQIEKRNNDALHANPDVFHYFSDTDIRLTVRGSDWYWAVTAVMIVSTLCFLGLSFTVPRRNRIFHYITAGITMVAAIAYFTMASNLGYASIIVEFARSDPKLRGYTREIFYVRYIDWFVTTPLLLLDLLLTAGLPWPTIVYTILLDEIMIVTGLVGALVASSYKWGYFVFATVALFGIAYNVCWVARLHANRLGSNVSQTFLLCGVWTIFLWFIYPISWGVSEGGNLIPPDSEAIFYGVLDILAKPCFGALLLWGHRNIDPAILGLHIRDYDDEIVVDEKAHHGVGAAAAPTNGLTGTGATTDNEVLGSRSNAVVGENTVTAEPNTTTTV